MFLNSYVLRIETPHGSMSRCFTLESTFETMEHSLTDVEVDVIYSSDWARGEGMKADEGQLYFKT
jgi:hypothetical protein